jgi:hypothetical protein
LKENELLYLPEKFSMDMSKDDKFNSEKRAELKRALRIAASEAGFTLVNKGWLRDSERIEYKCHRHRQYKDNRKKNKSKESSTTRPVQKDHLCPFGFPVIWDDDKELFFIKGGLGCPSHKHHLPKEPVEVRRGMGFQDEEQCQISIDLFASGADAATVRNYHLETCGDLLADGSLDYLRRTAMKLQEKAWACTVGENMTDIDTNLTEAQKLLQLLQATPGVSYHAIYSEVGSELLTSNRRDYNAARRRRRLRVVSRQEGETEESDGELFDFDDIEDCDDFKTYEANQRKAMSIPDEDRMLLIIAWTTDKSYHKFCQFPHCTSSDVTEKVNNVQHTLFMFALVTSNRQNAPAIWAYLPSQSWWAFACIWRKSIPALLPRTALMLMQLHFTDGDPMLYGPFWEAAPTIFGGCGHRLCGNHYRDRGELKKIPVGRLGDQGTALFRAIKAWIRSWFRSIETFDEYKHSRSLFDFWLQTNEITCEESVGADIACQVLETLVKTFDPPKEHYIQSFYLDTISYDCETSQSVETENVVIKRGGIKPNRTISRNTATILHNNNARELKNQQKSVVALDRSRVNPEGSSDTWKEQLDDLNESAYSDCNEQVEKAEWMAVWQLNAMTFYVKVKHYTDYSTCNQYRHDHFEDYMVPHYERTRVVSVHDATGGRKCLKCSCCFFRHMNGRPCAHQIKVSGRMPRMEDFWIVNTNLYDYFRHGISDTHAEVSARMSEIEALQLDGVQFDAEYNQIWQVGQGEEGVPLSYFEITLPTGPPLVRKGNYWSDDQPGGQAWQLVQKASDSADAIMMPFQGGRSLHDGARSQPLLGASGQFLQEETSFSQHCLTQEAAAMMSVESDDNAGAMMNFNDGDDGDFKDTVPYNPIAGHQYEVDGDDAEQALKEQFRQRKGSLFTDYSPCYQEMVKVAGTSISAFAAFEKRMPELLMELNVLSLQELEEATGHPVDTSMGLPQDQSTTSVSRLVPYYSPTRTRTKRRKLQTQSAAITAGAVAGAVSGAVAAAQGANEAELEEHWFV